MCFKRWIGAVLSDVDPVNSKGSTSDNCQTRILHERRGMADEDARHERTLFVVATLFAMYLRVSDLVGRDNWRPTMGEKRRDTMGNWWFHVVGKGNKAAKISVRDEYIQEYLVRYRRSLELSPLPSPQEKTPLTHPCPALSICRLILWPSGKRLVRNCAPPVYLCKTWSGAGLLLAQPDPTLVTYWSKTITERASSPRRISSKAILMSSSLMRCEIISSSLSRPCI